MEHDFPEHAEVAREVLAFRHQMATLARDSPIRGLYEQMLQQAYADGRRRAIRGLPEFECEQSDASSIDRLERPWSAKLPSKCPYEAPHVAGLANRAADRAQNDIWPAAVARVLNERLDTKYEILRPTTHRWGRPTR